MSRESLDDLRVHIEQLEWVVRCLFLDITGGDMPNAGTGIVLAMDKLSEIRKLISVVETSKEENKNG